MSPSIAGVAIRRWEHWPAAAFAILAALVALWARHELFPAYSWNRDEPVYLWHVDALREGRLAPSDGGYPSLFQPWLSARGEGVLFTQYTLGWPIVLLLADVVTTSAGSALLIGAALAVIGTYVFGLEVLGDRTIATAGAALMVASPILAIQGGVYLSYLFTLGLGLIAGALLLSGVRMERSSRLLAAGGLIGWIFLTRPYDALLWGAAFAAFAGVRHRDRVADAVKAVSLTAASALPLVVAALIYNRHVTGSWLQFPITAADPMDTFGFGKKRLMPGFEIVDYDLPKAIKATAKNAFLLPWFLAGTYVGLATALLGLWQRRREQAAIALLLVCLVFPVGYFIFWGNHLSSMAARISGPIYLIPLYAPICLLMASVLVDLWSRRRVAALALIAALVVATVPAVITRFQVNHEISTEQAAWRDSVEGIDGEALVFVADTAPYLLYVNPFSSNGPDLDDRILYASDSGPEMLDLIADMPNRQPFLQQGSVAAQDIGPRESPPALDVSLRSIEVRRAPNLTLSIRVSGLPTTSQSRLVLTSGAETHVLDLARRDGVVEVDLVKLERSDGLLVADRGTITITLEAGDLRARLDLVYRVVDSEMEVLLPAASYRFVAVEHGHDWRRTTSLDELQVDVHSG
ncbi:MAG: hypothetical protein ACOYXM_01000 [Actinomycetota bacterium]